MTNLLNTRILLSGATILAASAVIIGATFAFFSDTETSTGNTLAAGAIDLKIDNSSYYKDPATGNIVSRPENSWDLSDLTIEKFFSFTDIKPGDIGEDTISVHVNDNDAYVCAAAQVTEDSDVTYTEPELDDDSTVDEGDPLGSDGELAENLNFAFWADDGDNVLEESEADSIFLEGPISALGQAGQIALADSTNNVWTEGTAPVTGGSTLYIGKAWCFGDLVANPASEGTDNPAVRNLTGFDCNGASGANNAAQTDRVIGDLQFYAVQSRNNPTFSCATDYTPAWDVESQTVTIDSVEDLAANTVEASTTSKWFMWNDTNDTLDNSLGSFVSGPSTPPNGTGSLQFTLGANPQDRKNIATYQFAGTTLSSISDMSMGVYSVGGSGGAGPNESPYFNFNVDFNGTNVWQKRLVFVPSANGSVPQDSWNTFDMINGGNAMWTWSGYAANGNKWPDNNTSEYRTWNAILTAFPGVKVLSSDPWLGIRVGEPGPTSYIGNVDFFKMNSTTYDFDN